MSPTRVAIAPRGCIGHEHGGGMMWVFLNWALGLRDVGCDIIWLERLPRRARDEVGLHYVAPCVHLASWLQRPHSSTASFSTVAHWYASASLGADGDEKRHGFYPYLARPRMTGHSFELAVDIPDEEPELAELAANGWKTRPASEVAATSETYRQYVQSSFAEFSAAKPACVRLNYAWVSERTLNYLASGRPGVVQHTGRTAFLPDAAGMFRFRNVEEAARYVDLVVDDYQHQSLLARSLAEEFFDGRESARCVLEVALA